MKKISKPLSSEHALYYEKFIQDLPETVSVLDQLKIQAKQIEKDLLQFSVSDLCRPYAPDKWSLQDLLQHLIDCERVFVYRAMRFARGDQQPLSFFDEDVYAQHAQANKKTIKQLLKEYKTTRAATICFFQNLPAKTHKLTGIASQFPMSVRACVWIICGHEKHHYHIMQTRYFSIFNRI